MFEMFDESRKIRLNSIPSWRLLYGAIFYWQCLALAGRGRAGSRLVVWLPWPAGRLSGSQLIQTRLDSGGGAAVAARRASTTTSPASQPPSYHQSSPTVESGNIQRHLHHLHHHHQRTEKNI